MDLTLILSAAIFTLLAIVVATSLLNGSSLPEDGATAQRYSSHKGEARGPGLGQPAPQQNGHVPDSKSKEKAEDDWCDISGSSHDHWDVVKSVLSVSHTAAAQVTRRDGSACAIVFCLVTSLSPNLSHSATVEKSCVWRKLSDVSCQSC